MAEHNITGAAGEDFACQYLLQKGFTILQRNWRFLHKEIDIIARSNDGWLVFVEVKTRSEAVVARDIITESKIRYLHEAAERYIEVYTRTEEARFDVLLLTKRWHGYEVEHIEYAF